MIKCDISADESLVCAGSSDGFTYIWDSETGELRSKLGGHFGSVNDVSFHPLTNIVASASTDKTVIVGEF